MVYVYTALMVTSILHLSDLHRDSGSAITTNSLLDSLRRDMVRYLAEGLPAPNLAVISGDIVYGVSSDGPEADAALKGQYVEASSFLAELAQLFFGGDRERIVLVPGNHDVSHPHVLRATEAAVVPTDAPQRSVLATQLAEGTSQWRWVASEFALRRLHDQETYRRRFEPYADFYAAFYRGKRTFSLDPCQQFAVHDFPECGMVVAALSSCCDNDLFNRAGRIHPDCVAGSTRAVSDLVKQGRIALAVWHHNLAGGPRDTDYVDADFLQSLIDGGFVMGLHGHQHRPQLLDHRFAVDRRKGISVVSAGTLCGGPRALPPGRMRSYNLVVIDEENKTGTVHVRAMKNSGFGLPVWGPAYIDEFSGSFMAFDIEVPSRSESLMKHAIEAEELLRRGDYDAAFKIASLSPEDALARRVAVEAVTRIGDWVQIQHFCSPPRSAPEFVVLADALYQTGNKDELNALLRSEYARTSTDAGVRQAIDLASIRLRGR